jgi:hypothetical protein
MFRPYVNLTTTHNYRTFSKIAININYQKINVDPPKAGINYEN